MKLPSLKELLEGELTEDKIRTLKAAAAEFSEQGRCLELQGLPEQAEQVLLLSLGIRSFLFEKTSEESEARAAREDCTSLADLSMQLGNMHGADFYYAKALEYGGEIHGKGR